MQQLLDFSHARIQGASLQVIGHPADHAQHASLMCSMRDARRQVRLCTAGAQRAHKQCRHIQQQRDSAAEAVQYQRTSMPARWAELKAQLESEVSA